VFCSYAVAGYIDKPLGGPLPLEMMPEASKRFQIGSVARTRMSFIIDDYRQDMEFSIADVCKIVGYNHDGVQVKFGNYLILTFGKSIHRLLEPIGEPFGGPIEVTDMIREVFPIGGKFEIERNLNTVDHQGNGPFFIRLHTIGVAIGYNRGVSVQFYKGDKKKVLTFGKSICTLLRPKNVLQPYWWEYVDRMRQEGKLPELN
jgi:hypothetical protein